MKTPWSPSTGTTRAPGMAAAIDRCRAVGTSTSRDVTTTAAGTSTPPIHDADENRPRAAAHASIVAGRWRASSSAAHGASGRSPNRARRVLPT